MAPEWHFCSKHSRGQNVGFEGQKSLQLEKYLFSCWYWLIIRHCLHTLLRSFCPKRQQKSCFCHLNDCPAEPSGNPKLSYKVWPQLDPSQCRTSRGCVNTLYSKVTVACQRLSVMKSAGAPRCWRTESALVRYCHQPPSRCPGRNSISWQDMYVMYQPANLLTQQGDARGVLKPSPTPPLRDLRLLSAAPNKSERLVSIHGEGGRVHGELFDLCKVYFLPFPCCTFEVKCLKTPVSFREHSQRRHGPSITFHIKLC